MAYLPSIGFQEQLTIRVEREELAKTCFVLKTLKLPTMKTCLLSATPSCLFGTQPLTVGRTELDLQKLVISLKRLSSSTNPLGNSIELSGLDFN